MQRFVVCAFTVLAIGAVGACSSSSDNNGSSAGLGSFTSAVLAVDSSPVVLHVYVDPTDPTAYLPTDNVDRTPTVTILPQNLVVPNGNNNVSASFSDPSIADFDSNGLLEGLAPGTTVLTYTFTDYNHARATQSINIPITVLAGPAPGRLVH